MSTDAVAMSQADADISIHTGAWKDRQPASASGVGESQGAADEHARGREAGGAGGFAEVAEAMRKAMSAEAAYRDDPMGPGNTVAFLEALEAARDVARIAHRRAILKANDDVQQATARAGSNAVAREQAKAKAMTENARRLGETESAAEDASLAYDRGLVDVARTCKIAEVRIKFARERLAEREAAGADVLQKANPFSAPHKFKITESEFDAITDPAMKARAAREAIVVPDPPVAFTRGDAAKVLQSRGSAGRRLLTMSEFNRLSPADQAEAARSAILFDE